MPHTVQSSNLWQRAVNVTPCGSVYANSNHQFFLGLIMEPAELSLLVFKARNRLNFSLFVFKARNRPNFSLFD